MIAKGRRRQADEYQDIRWLASGQHGDVYKCVHLPTGKLYAHKLLNLFSTDESRAQIIRELSVLLRPPGCVGNSANSGDNNNNNILPPVTNENILRLHASYIDNDRLNLIVDYCADGSLLDHITKYGPIRRESELAFIAKSVLNGLSYMKTKFKLHHRDLKPANLLLSKGGCLKIADFGESGLAKCSPVDSLDFGTTGYKPPECLLPPNKEGIVIIDPEKVDTWALGITLLECCRGRHPFADATEIEMLATFDDFRELQAIMLADMPTNLARHFVSECLQTDPGRRASISDLLQHPFLLKASSSLTLH